MTSMNEERMNVSVHPLVLLDLFCCAGGAGEGYRREGFDVVGVDIAEQPRNPHTFIQGDALEYLEAHSSEYDLIHASPPCQQHTALRGRTGKTYRCYIDELRAILETLGVPWVIENVPGAPLRNPVTLCGTMFGLGAQGHELQRHRLFESSFPIAQPECQHTEKPVIGVYGGHARNRSAKHGGRGTADAWKGGHKAAASEAMGIDWMSMNEISQAIPPAYTQHVAREFLKQNRQIWRKGTKDSMRSWVK